MTTDRLSSLDERFVKHVLDAVERVTREGVSRQGDLLAVFRPGNQPSSGTRQARHARQQRAIVTAAAALTVMALEEDDFSWVFVSPDFARLRANSADVHVRIGEFFMTRGARFGARIEHVWSTQSQALIGLCERFDSLDESGLLILHSALVPLFSCAVVGGPAIGEAWSALWSDLGPHVERNPSLYMHVAMIGAFAGRPEPLAEALLKEHMLPYSCCAGLCLVRRERSDELLEVIAAMMSGRALDPSLCLHPARPGSTIVRLAEYARSCMRNPRHFFNEGLVLNVLQWQHDASALVAGLSDEGPDERSRVRAEISKMEHVQLLEKKRFWDVHDGTSSDPVRARLAALWLSGQPEA